MKTVKILFITIMCSLLTSCTIFINNKDKTEEIYFFQKNVRQINASGLSDYSDLSLTIGYYPSGNYSNPQKQQTWKNDFSETFNPAIDINYFNYSSANPPVYKYDSSFDDGVLTLKFSKIDSETIDDSSSTEEDLSLISGYVTWYDGADEPTVAYYVPEIEEGWYHCAVSEDKYESFPPGTAIELSANNKTVHLLVTDLCPNSEIHSYYPDFYFDLEKAAFQILADESVGELNVSFKTVPYPTNENIKIEIKGGVNEWWLSFRFFNMRYPIKRIEFSQDGKSYYIVKPLLIRQNNWFVADNGSDLLNGQHYFRLTDIYGQTIKIENHKRFEPYKIYDLGKNFEW